MIQVAAVGDVHCGVECSGKIKQYVPELEKRADLFLIAGDLTKVGHVEEVMVLSRDLKGSQVPTVMVLGNHDYHSNQQTEITQHLESEGLYVLEQSSVTFDIKGCRVGVYGLKGFGGGYLGACGSDFGEPEMKSFVRHTKRMAQTLHEGLMNLDADFKIVLMHYSPTPDTLKGEKPEIYPFLGSYLLGQAVDEAGADVIFHGHAHKGVEKGLTPGGIPVRNVAQPVIKHAFNIYSMSEIRRSHQPVMATPSI